MNTAASNILLRFTVLCCCFIVYVICSISLRYLINILTEVLPVMAEHPVKFKSLAALVFFSGSSITGWYMYRKIEADAIKHNRPYHQVTIRQFITIHAVIFALTLGTLFVLYQ